MTEVSAFDAKTHFSKLLKRARDGEEITITLHGEPVARLAPLERKEDRSSAVEAMEEILSIRQQIVDAGHAMSREEIVALVREGREQAMRRSFGATSGADETRAKR